MKKIIIAAVITSLVVLAAGCQKKQAEIAREGLVNFLSGEVFLVSDGNKTAAQVGDVVKQGMKIITGKKAFVDIYFGENAVKILENTIIEVKKLIVNPQLNAEESELHLEKGNAFSKISKKLSKGDSYKISTPTTIAAIRGTDFMVSEENGKGKVSCIEGKVAVKDATVEKSEFVEVKAGEEVEVEPGKPLSVKELSELNRKNLRQIKEEIREMQKDIRRRFEEQREQIRQVVKDQKARNREMIDNRKAEDKQRVEDQKGQDKANIDAIKGDMKDKQETLKEGVDTQKEENKKAMEGVKPDVKKFSADGSGLKPDLNVKPEIKKDSIK